MTLEFGDEQVRVVMPAGALGASPLDTELDSLLRELAVAANARPQDWAEKYGTSVDNDVFMMHRYCWCEESACPWCAGCECPDNSFHYFVDGEEVSFDGWVDCHVQATQGLQFDSAEYERASRRANARRSRRHDAVCDFCLRRGLFGVAPNNEPDHGAPNFWYKPTDFKVWWYKYIGRSTETNRQLSADELVEMRNACRAAV